MIGFEDLNVNSELNLSPHDIENEDEPMMKTHLNQVILTLVPLILTPTPMEYFQMRKTYKSI